MRIFSVFNILTVICSVVFSTNTFAESGYRTCFVVSERDIRHGLVAKVANANGGDTCNKKVAFMKNYYANAYSNDTGPFQDVEMLTCEKFSQIVMGMGGNADMCKSMTVNKIYKYTVKDSPSGASVKFWHN